MPVAETNHEAQETHAAPANNKLTCPTGTGELQTPVNVSAGRARFKTSRLGDSRPFLCPSVRYDQITMDRFYARPSDLLVPVLSTKPEEAEGWVQCHLGHPQPRSPLHAPAAVMAR